jgi:4-aminobutyrate aminotransferase-like enzyme
MTIGAGALSVDQLRDREAEDHDVDRRPQPREVGALVGEVIAGEGGVLAPLDRFVADTHVRVRILP